ncbi:hypothetical protein L798_03263 [Zootermopsis nevadensis]|uniref:Uncharacterized protein n=1 Tax=Zootermopsis nevadensis TaxID=136037 RepID=A0A067QGD4_ZOONE|nr:hypothetical protein L798_03263 [Zootermopsis nevadensis]
MIKLKQETTGGAIQFIRLDLIQVALEGLKAVSVKTAVFWVAAPCSLIEVYQHFRGPFCLHHQDDESSHEAARTSETSVNFYQTTIQKAAIWSRDWPDYQY